MAAVKQQAIDLIQALPDDCSFEDIQYHLYVLAKVERGIQAVEAGDTVSQAEAEQKVQEWLRSAGQARP